VLVPPQIRAVAVAIAEVKQVTIAAVRLTVALLLIMTSALSADCVRKNVAVLLLIWLNEINKNATCLCAFALNALGLYSTDCQNSQGVSINATKIINIFMCFFSIS